jgi:hypothetical protein
LTGLSFFNQWGEKASGHAPHRSRAKPASPWDEANYQFCFHLACRVPLARKPLLARFWNECLQGAATSTILNITNTMKCNPWTVALMGVGLVSLPAVLHAEEKPSALQTALSTTTLSGYVDTSAHWNPGTGNANLPNYTPNGVAAGSKADGFNLDVVNITLAHPVGEGDWGAGYNVTLLFGPDATGYNTSFFGNGTQAATSDFSLKDTYVDLRAPIGNGLDLKLGTFTEILGYEVFEAGNNPNYTRSFGYEIEPTALTGALATYQISSAFTAMFGIANTWSAGVNSRAFPPVAPGPNAKAESFKTYMGSLAFTAPTNTGFLAGSTISGGIISGYDEFNDAQKTSYYIGATVNTPVTGLKAGIAFDYVTLGNNNLGVDPADPTATLAENSGYQYAIGLYLAFQATEKLGFYTRGEYESQSGYLAQRALVNGVGFPKSGYEFTQTIQYDLWKNVLARLEFRWDHAEHGNVYGGTLTDFGAGTSPTAAGNNEFLLAANLIYKF